jgi:hypothetical protein
MHASGLLSPKLIYIAAPHKLSENIPISFRFFGTSVDGAHIAPAWLSWSEI